MRDVDALNEYLILDEMGFFVFGADNWLPLGATEYVACVRENKPVDLVRVSLDGSVGEFKGVCFRK